MWVRTDYGVENRFLTAPLRIPERGYYWTWGVNGDPRVEPDEWHFHVVFTANKTADVVLLWNMNESILFERSSAKIDEGFDVALPKTTEIFDRNDGTRLNFPYTTFVLQNAYFCQRFVVVKDTS